MVKETRHPWVSLPPDTPPKREAEAALYALLDDEASKLRILDYLRKWLGDNLEQMPANRA